MGFLFCLYLYRVTVAFPLHSAMLNNMPHLNIWRLGITYTVIVFFMLLGFSAAVINYNYKTHQIKRFSLHFKGESVPVLTAEYSAGHSLKDIVEEKNFI